MQRIFQSLVRPYALLGLLTVAVAVTLVLEALGIAILNTSNRAYRLLSIFFLIGWPSTIFVVTLIAFLSKAAVDWMKRNA